MAKVFRFHEDSKNEDWFVSDQYGSTAIDGIKDPSGETPNQEITSIPSPFARIDLVKTAFKFVVNTDRLDDNTIYHKLVSDCLDLAEIIFNIDSFKDKIQVIPWSKTNDLNSLLTSNNSKHVRYGNTLKLFLDQDQKEYNFDRVEKLYIILFDHKVIGGTSPVTLFFPATGDLSFVNVRFGSDKMFDPQYNPLYKREPEFQKYLFALRKSIPNFSTLFEYFNEYLDANLAKLDSHNHELYLEINNLENSYFNELEGLEIPGQAGNLMEILGYPLKKKSQGPEPIEDNSDFVIKSDKYTKRPKPLVLQNNFNRRLKYTSDYWDSSYKVPYFDDKPLEERVLPELNEKYPYLTIDDFLEPHLIKTIYPINESKYFNSNFSSEEFGFIPPLKIAFFDYFDSSFLNKSINGKKVFEVEPLAGGSIKAILRIPIKNEHITFERIYFPSSSEDTIGTADVSRNKGVIVENQFGVSIFPFLRTENTNNAFYRVMLVDRDINSLTKENEYHLNFYDDQNKLVKPLKRSIRRNKQDANDGGSSTLFYVLDKDFSYIELNNNTSKGVIIPLFQKYSEGNDAFTFAIDFGTTNTHIEYSINGGPPSPFEILANDMQIANLIDPKAGTITDAPELTELVNHEFIPSRIGSDSDYRFPMRTGISEKKGLDVNNNAMALADLNIPFNYEKRDYSFASIHTNLKWSNYPNQDIEKVRVKSYFESLIFMIRNKVLLNGGKLNQTKIISFYPSSMLAARRDNLNLLINGLAQKYLDPVTPPIQLSESIAPFYYYKSRLQVDAGDKPVVAIDIGGGTSDIVVYENNKPLFLTSSRFASQSIYGDAFNGAPENNGFVLKYYDKVKVLAEGFGNTSIKALLTSIRNQGVSSSLVDLFYSLENNKDVQRANSDFSFSNMLQADSKLKYVILLFYSALIYHIAKLLKEKNITTPRFITFSGTGSKVLNILDSTNDLKRLESFTKLIFSHVYGEEIIERLELKDFPHPKEITCKGGIIGLNDIKEIEIEELKTVNHFEGENKPITYSDLEDDSILNKTKQEVIDFLDMFYKLQEEFDFENYFGIETSLTSIKEMKVEEDIMRFIKSGISERQEGVADKNTQFEDSLFFFPITGIINQIAYKLAKEESNV